MTAEPDTSQAVESAPGPAPGTGTIVTFYSYKGGTGRSMALANVGWILASQGLRVLVVDWDLEAPGLHRYYHPLLVDPELHATDGLIDLLRAYVDQALPGPDEAAALGPGQWLSEPGRVEGYLCGLALDLPAGGRLDLMPAGRQNAAYSAAVTSFNWRSFYGRGDIRGAEFLNLLRERWTSSYDYVLIDSRTGVSDTSGICTVLMPDTVVDCFTLGVQSIRGGVDAARTIADADVRDIRVLPVPMRVEDAERAGLEAGRDLAQQSFAPYLARWLGADRWAEYWRDVEVPYNPFYAYEEVPATVVDGPRQGRSLLGAFERLAAWLTDGRVRSLSPVPEQVRRRLYAAYLRTGRTRSRQIHISYAPGDRIWAEWAGAVLAGFGYLPSLHGAVAPFDPDDGAVPPEAAGPLDGDGRILVLLSPEYAALPRAREIWRRLAPAGPDGSSPALLALRVAAPDAPLPEPFGGPDAPALVRSGAADAEAQLFELVGPAPGAGRWAQGDGEPAPARFPDDLTGHRLPMRNGSFTGRGPLLELLRDRFTAGSTGVSVQVLYGLGGVGKSQTATEYAHRFAAAYDLVCWVPAEEPAGIAQKLADLAPVVGVPQESDAGRTASAVLDALGRGGGCGRWLLVYDNAQAPDRLTPWLPVGSADGHVIVTSRDRRWARHAGRVEVEVFDRAESVALLRGFNAGVPVADANRIAALLGDLPLAVGQAAAWLQETPMPAATYLELLRDSLAEVLDRTGSGPADYPHSTAATWRLAVDALRRVNDPAARLLEVCAFFGPDAIPTRLLYGGTVIEALGPPAGSDPIDPLAISGCLRAVHQFGLAAYDPVTETISVHRLVQAVLRDLVPEGERPRIRAAVHRALALADAGDPDLPGNWGKYAELLPHLVPSGALESTDPAVRRWITDSVRYQWQRGLYAFGRELAERALACWLADGWGGPAHDRGNDLHTLLLRAQLGNIQRLEGAADEAYETDRDVLERLRATVGPEDRHVISVANSLGGDLRLLGRYREARALDRENLEAARRVLGETDPKTFMITNNLAISEALVGNAGAALAGQRAVHRRQREHLGPRHTYALSSAVNLAVVLREAGQLQESRELLEEAVRGYLVTLGEDHNDTLRARRNLGAALRRLGALREALAIGEDVHRRSLAHYGPAHRGTVIAAASLAAELNALGDGRRALELAEEVLGHCRDRRGERHPVSLAAAVNLSAYLRRAGRAAPAGDHSGRASQQLRAVLGARHPHVAVALSNHSDDLAAAGDSGAAVAVGEQAVALFAGACGDDHHDTVSATSNLALVLGAAGEGARAAALAADCLARARRTLGATHPISEGIREGRRIDLDIELPDG